jgi:transcription initiation factor TFIIIB Brf1 subunit/transcription initiation factor TFIIB
MDPRCPACDSKDVTLNEETGESRCQLCGCTYVDGVAPVNQDEESDTDEDTDEDMDDGQPSELRENEDFAGDNDPRDYDDPCDFNEPDFE